LFEDAPNHSQLAFAKALESEPALGAVVVDAFLTGRCRQHFVHFRPKSAIDGANQGVASVGKLRPVCSGAPSLR